MTIRDRLMSRASVAVMAAFAPKKDGDGAAVADTSKVGQAENVDDEGASNSDSGGDDLGLSAEEQAQFDAMQAGRGPGGKEDIEAGAAGDDGGGDDAAEDEPTDGADGAADEPRDGVGADGQAVEEQPREPKSVSYGKFKRERDKLQAQLDAAKTETAKEREARVRLDERTKQLLEAIQSRPKQEQPAPEPKDEDPEPDGEQDPIGHLQWSNRRLAKQVEDLTSGRRREQEVSAAEREERQVYDAFQADLEREAQADPTFAEAFVHLRETRYRELGFIYADIDITDPEQCATLSIEQQGALKQQIQRGFHNEQMLVAKQALQAKKSPAKVVKNLAKARGWAAKVAEAVGAAGDEGGAGAGGGKSPAKPNGRSGNGKRQEVGVSEQLDAIRAGQANSRSLSDAGGSPGGDMTPERIAEMSDEDFEDFLNGHKKQLDRALGKPS